MKETEISDNQRVLNLLIKPKKFFKAHKNTKLADMPLLVFVMIIFGSFHGIDRVEKSVQKVVLNPDTTNVLTESWITYWGVVVLASIVAGGISYLIGTWFYNLRIKWSKGEDSKELAQKIFLYSFLLVGIINLVTTMLDNILYSTPAEVYLSEFFVLESVEMGLLLLLIGALFHSLFISYKGVLTVKGISKVRAMIWFVILPGLWYVLAFVGIILAILYST